MEFTIDDQIWNDLSYEEKNHALYLRQVDTLDMFLERGAITQAEHDKSLHDLTVKMGEAKISATTEGANLKRTIIVHHLDHHQGDNEGDNKSAMLELRKRAIIELLKQNPDLSIEKTAQMLSLTKRQVERTLSVLKSEGIICRQGSARFGQWIVKE